LGSEDYLHALETMGKILLFTPILVALLLFIMGFPGKGSDMGSDAVFSVNLMMSAGFFTLLYVSIFRYREGVREAEYGEG
jgi:hypothetical protein